MSKRIILLFAILLFCAISTGCSKPYDARAIDHSSVDSPDQQERSTPAAGGGKALKESQW